MPKQSEQQKASIRKEYRDNNKEKIAIQKKDYYQRVRKAKRITGICES